MVRRGRPPSPRAASARIVHIKIRLYPGEDDDLIPFFDGIPPGLRAAMVKEALRSGAQGRSETVCKADDALDLLDSLVG